MSAVFETCIADAPAFAAPQADDHRALRFLTAGSVDDGKSTLIGRLLFDSRAILADQLDQLEQRSAGAPIDLSLLTDGLEAEREQGITIDVAYRYFATPRRKFIIADAPGHEQYTRNMVTAAAGSDAAVVLVDITKIDWAASPVQLLPQTRRHALLAHLLRVPCIVFAVNKIDALDQPQPAFEAVRHALLGFAREAGMAVAAVVPVSALRGDNITRPLDAPWYRGPSLLQVLEGLPSAQENVDGALLLPVQYVAREQSVPGEGGTGHQPRTLWGRIAQGSVRAGDAVQLFPSGELATVPCTAPCQPGGGAGGSRSVGWAGARPPARRVARRLDRHARTPCFPHNASAPRWPGWTPNRRWSAASTWCVTATAGCRRASRPSATAWTCSTLQPTNAHELAVNEIGRVVMELQQPLPLQPYASNRVAGALIVVDPGSHRTSGALLVHSVR